MIRIFFILFFSATFSASSYCQNINFDNASDYNNFIVEEQNQLILRIIDYNISNLHNNNIQENNTKRLEIITQIEASSEKINSLPAYKGDSRLKEEALIVFRLYKDACDVEFDEINQLRRDRENSFEAMEVYFKTLDKAEKKLKEAGEDFLKAQKDFAKKNRISIKDVHKNYFEEIGQVNQYSRHVTLQYFRVSKVDANFLDALNNQQASMMEENRKQILSAADLSLASLASLTPYKTDSTYKIKAIQLIHYHQTLAANEYVELVNILTKKERTQNDINRYNQIVIQVNEKSQRLLDDFNKENKEMLKRNIPLY